MSWENASGASLHEACRCFIPSSVFLWLYKVSFSPGSPVKINRDQRSRLSVCSFSVLSCNSCFNRFPPHAHSRCSHQDWPASASVLAEVWGHWNLHWGIIVLGDFSTVTSSSFKLFLSAWPLLYPYLSVSYTAFSPLTNDWEYCHSLLPPGGFS